MTALTCPNCHQPISAADDICENCGAVLSSTPVNTSTAFASTVSNSPSVSATSVGSNTLCPNCHQPVNAADDICENCGAVLGTVETPQRATGTNAVASTIPNDANECPQCHYANNRGAKFCNHCGFRLSATTGSTASAPIAQSLPPETNTRLGIGSILNEKYHIVKEIGEGGMGSVYLAEDRVLKRRVVIKALLSEDDPDLVEQSVKEREFLAAIKHVNIVSIYDFITIGTRGYIVMEYVQGKTLEQIMDEQGQPFAVADAINYIIGILPAFSYMAKLELVYCDFKPQNVMLEVLKDGSQIVKLIDLGTVIKYEPRPHAVYGTHGFYAPEAVKTPSPETDLYSICRTLAYMVTMMDLSDPIFGMPTIERYRVFRDYPELYRLLYKGTHPQAARRFHSAQELSDQLVGVLRLIVGGKPGAFINSRLFVSRNTTTSGKLGLHGETELDENDKAIDLLRYGDQALHSGNETTALGFYQQAINTNARSVDAHLRCAEIYTDQGAFERAQSEIQTAQKIDPANWRISWYTARLGEAQGRFEQAITAYQALTAELPGELPPIQALARAHSHAGDDATAVQLYTTVLKADPGNTDAILGITDSLLKLQRWHEVTTVLSGVSEAAAKYVDAQLMLCDLYLYRIAPLTAQNIEYAARAVNTLAGRTEDARYYLARGDVYRASWQLARARRLPSGVSIAGVADTRPETLGAAAEESYKEYLRRAENPVDREQVVRRKIEVSPWRIW